LSQRHLTWDVGEGMPFLGYYSVAFAYLVTVSYRLNLFGVFDLSRGLTSTLLSGKMPQLLREIVSQNLK
jgi:hypothetical protein